MIGHFGLAVDYDVAILDRRSAGYAAARTAAAAGLRTVVLENGAEVGGLCILRGCSYSCSREKR